MLKASFTQRKILRKVVDSFCQGVVHVGLLPGGRAAADRVPDPGREVQHEPRHEGREEQEDGVPHQHHHRPQQPRDDGLQSCHQRSFLRILFWNVFS